MEYYRVLNNKELWHPDGHLLGKDGDVVALDTDSEDKKTRKAALAVLAGQAFNVTRTEKPEKVSKKKVTKKGATYKTKDATPEG